MENSMDERSSKVRQVEALVNFIRLIGVLCFISTGLNVLPWKYAVLAGLACFLLAPAVRQGLLAK